MRRIFKQLHLWLSLPFGVIITITCFTGAMLVFENEITELCNYRIAYVTPGDKPLSIDAIIADVGATLGGGVAVSGVVVPSSPEKAYKVNLSKPKHAALYVNQYTGEVLGNASRFEFFRVMRYLHRWLMDSSRGSGGIFWGRLIVGTSTIVFVFVLLTGIVIWWPRTLKALKNRIGVVASKGWKRLLYDMHVTGGFYTILFLLVMALTGLTWSFRWYRNGVYSLLDADGGTSVVINTGKFVDLTSDVASSGPWQRAYDAVAAVNEDKQITVSKGRVTVALGGFGNQSAADRYDFDTVTGKITNAQLYENTARKSKISGWIYTLHTGSWGGMLVRIIYFLTALLGATLPITGYYLWLRRIIKKG